MLKLCVADVSHIDTDASLYSLSDYRLRKLEHMTRPQARRQSIGAELLLDYALKERSIQLPRPLKISCGRHGRPFLENSGLCFSLSHSGDYAACALSDSQVGVDIQRIIPGKTEISRRFFSSDEQQSLLCAADMDDEFTRIWTLKESCIKALGMGLSIPLSDFSVLTAPHIKVMGSTLEAAAVRMGDYYLALCASRLEAEPAPEMVSL